MRRLVLLLVHLATAVLSGCQKAPPSTQAESDTGSPPRDEAGFTRYVAQRLAAALGEGFKVTIEDRLTLDIQGAPGRDEHKAYLYRIYDYCARDPAGCAHAISQHVASAVETTREIPLERANLRVVIRTAEYVADWPRQSENDPLDELVTAPLAGSLLKLCVADRQYSTMPLSLNDVKRLGLLGEEAMNLCERNLASTLPPLASVLRPLVGDLPGRIDDDGDYEASRLARHDDWAALASGLEGGLVVAAPHAGLVLYDDAGRPGAVKRLRSAAQEAAAIGPRPLSAELFTWTPNGWRPLLE